MVAYECRSRNKLKKKQLTAHAACGHIYTCNALPAAQCSSNTAGTVSSINIHTDCKLITNSDSCVKENQKSHFTRCIVTVLVCTDNVAWRVLEGQSSI